MPTPLKIAVVIASSRPERAGPTVAAWVMDGTRNRAAATYELVDLAGQDSRIGHPHHRRRVEEYHVTRLLQLFQKTHETR